MRDYKINIIFNEDNISIEDIFTKVLLKELLVIFKNENMTPSSWMQFFLNEGGKN